MQNLWNDPEYQRLRLLLAEAIEAKTRYQKEIIRLEQQEYSRVQQKFPFQAVLRHSEEAKTP